MERRPEHLSPVEVPKDAPQLVELGDENLKLPAEAKSEWRKSNDVLREMRDRHFANAQKEIAELGYEPLDVCMRLRSMLRLTDQEQTLSRQNRHELKAKRLRDFQNEVKNFTADAGLLITDLRDAVFTNPDVSEDELRALIRQRAPVIRLPAMEYSWFTSAAEEYVAKHRAVEKFRAEHPDDNDLFEASFGFRPDGVVRVEKGPRTLLFRVYEFGDYERLWTKGVEEGTPRYERRKKSAEMSGGYATHDAPTPELRDTLTVERMSEEPSYEGPDTEKKFSTNARGAIAFWNEQNAPADFTIEGAGTWRVTHDKGYYARWALEKLGADGQLVPVRELTFGNKGFHDKTGAKLEENLRTELKDDAGETVGHFIFNDEALELELEGPARNIDVTLRRTAERRPLSQTTRLHEEQHAFDAFTNLHFRFEDYEILRGLAVTKARAEANPDDATRFDPKQGLLRSLARRERYGLIDQHARLEFLAYFRAGQGITYAETSLSDDEGNYAFAQSLRGGLESVAKRVVSRFESLAGDIFPDAKLTPEDVLPIVQEVFGSEYKKMLAKWAEAVRTIFDKADYDTEDAIGLLTTQPINGWPRLARMMERRGAQNLKSKGIRRTWGEK